MPYRSLCGSRTPIAVADAGSARMGLVLFALIYAVVGRLLSLIVVRGRGEASKDVELVLLRHEISVLRRQLPRPRLAPADRLIMAAFARHLPASLRKFRVRADAAGGASRG